MLLTYLEQNRLEAGCDEAGRGCLAGPVFAAAVILPEDFQHELLQDSKKMTEKERFLLRPIIEKSALAFAVAQINHEEIDKINILNASIAGMNLAVQNLKIKPDFLLIDGNRFKTNSGIPYQCIVKGDGKFASIAAASVLAKTYRDQYMESIHNQYPEYNWKQNKGYPTKNHRDMIVKYGISPYHRKTFKLLAEGNQDLLFLDLS
jgi:ribonuclease HII